MTTILNIAKSAARAYLTASKRLDGDELNHESKRIRHEHGIAANIAGFSVAEIDALFDDMTANLVAPTEEGVCRAIIALKAI